LLSRIFLDVERPFFKPKWEANSLCLISGLSK
jgi:hypothetical protein